ncbi:MAG TPA: hypothetical protein RMH99_28245 [Sandaracinaceae bacterium LLY-WYZ-13_1]|nr:hypothetical protein [Sandaracinaceae bacterium LLY-WYZ-13_1]
MGPAADALDATPRRLARHEGTWRLEIEGLTRVGAGHYRPRRRYLSGRESILEALRRHQALASSAASLMDSCEEDAVFDAAHDGFRRAAESSGHWADDAHVEALREEVRALREQLRVLSLRVRRLEGRSGGASAGFGTDASEADERGASRPSEADGHGASGMDEPAGAGASRADASRAGAREDARSASPRSDGPSAESSASDDAEVDDGGADALAAEASGAAASGADGSRSEGAGAEGSSDAPVTDGAGADPVEAASPGGASGAGRPSSGGADDVGVAEGGEAPDDGAAGASAEPDVPSTDGRDASAEPDVPSTDGGADASADPDRASTAGRADGGADVPADRDGGADASADPDGGADGSAAPDVSTTDGAPDASRSDDAAAERAEVPEPAEDPGMDEEPDPAGAPYGGAEDALDEGSRPPLELPEASAFGRTLESLLGQDLEVVDADGPVELGPALYWTPLRDPEDRVIGAVAVDHAAVIEHGGILLMLPDAARREMLDHDEPSDDVVEGMNEVVNVLSRCFNDVPGNTHVRTGTMERVDAEAEDWMARARRRRDLVDANGGRIVLLAR